MTSLAAVHTAAALIVRALGEAGVSAEVVVAFDTNGIVVRPKPGIDTVDWRTAVEAVAEVCDADGTHLFCTGRIDGIAVTASWWLIEAVAS